MSDNTSDAVYTAIVAAVLIALSYLVHLAGNR